MAKVSSPQRLELIHSFHDLLLHKSSLLEGLMLRVAGMESLAQNLINLFRKGLTFLETVGLGVNSSRYSAIPCIHVH